MRIYSSLVTLSLLWGSSFVVIKFLLEPAGIWGMIFIRCLLGFLAVVPVLLIRRKKNKKITRNIPWWPLLFAGLFNASIPWGFIAWSETVITSNTTSVLNALAPIMTGLIGFFLFNKYLVKIQWIGIMIGFFGILVLLNFDVIGILSENFIGVGTMIVATILYGIGSHYTKIHLQDTDISLIVTITLLFSSISALIIAVFTETLPNLAMFDLTVVLSLLWLGVFSSGIAHLLYYYLMLKGTPETATSVTYMVPISAFFWGYTILNEPITSNLVIGLLIILIGVYLTSKAKKPIV